MEKPQSVQMKGSQLKSTGHDSLCWLGHRFTGSLNWPADLSHPWFALQV